MHSGPKRWLKRKLHVSVIHFQKSVRQPWSSFTSMRCEHLMWEKSGKEVGMIETWEKVSLGKSVRAKNVKLHYVNYYRIQYDKFREHIFNGSFYYFLFDVNSYLLRLYKCLSTRAWLIKQYRTCDKCFIYSMLLIADLFIMYDLAKS